MGVLQTLPASSVDSIVTSPPYWGQREYGVLGELGAEPTWREYLDRLLEVFEEARRVLKPTGSLWVNLGDKYAGNPKKGGTEPRSKQQAVRPAGGDHGLSDKCLIGLPWRFALAMVDTNWILRNDAVWAKANPLPESVKDRLSCTHEYLPHFVKQQRYFYDLGAIRIPALTDPRKLEGRRIKFGGNKAAGYGHGRYSGNVYQPGYRAPGQTDEFLRQTDAAHYKDPTHYHPDGKNPGDVWFLPTVPFHGEHYAVFPPMLALGPILATCPKRCCVACGLPWWPVDASAAVGKDAGARPSCKCNAEWQPGTVLDPFGGTGTVSLVARDNGRNSIWIDLDRRNLQFVMRERKFGQVDLLGTQVEVRDLSGGAVETGE